MTETELRPLIRKLADEMYLGSMHPMSREGVLRAVRETLKLAEADPKLLPDLFLLWDEVIV